MFKSIAITVFYLLLLTVLGVTAQPDRHILKRSPTAETDDASTWTNAKRLQLGLTPRKPQSLYTPTIGARNPIVSGTSTKQCYVKASTLGWSKYVSKTKKGGNTYYGVDEPVSKRMTVSFTPGNGPVELTITSGSTYPKLGFAGGDLGLLLGAPNYLTDTNSATKGNGPTAVGNGRAPGIPNSESFVWDYSSLTKEFTARWIQGNGSSVSPMFWYIPSQDGIVITRHPILGGWQVWLFCDSL